MDLTNHHTLPTNPDSNNWFKSCSLFFFCFCTYILWHVFGMLWYWLWKTLNSLMSLIYLPSRQNNDQSEVMLWRLGGHEFTNPEIGWLYFNKYGDLLEIDEDLLASFVNKSRDLLIQIRDLIKQIRDLLENFQQIIWIL